MTTHPGEIPPPLTPEQVAAYQGCDAELDTYNLSDRPDFSFVFPLTYPLSVLVRVYVVAETVWRGLFGSAGLQWPWHTVYTYGRRCAYRRHRGEWWVRIEDVEINLEEYERWRAAYSLLSGRMAKHAKEQLVSSLGKA